MNPAQIISYVLIVASFAFPAFAGKGGGATGGSGTKCRTDRNIKPLVISSIVKQSSRRIKIITQAGSYMGNPTYPGSYTLVDSNGALVSNLPGGVASGGPQLLEFHVEGLNANASYSIKANPEGLCHLGSAEVSFSMPADIPENNIAIVTKVETVNIAFVNAKTILVYTTDDTGIASQRMFINGVFFSERRYGHGYMESLRYWTDLPSPYSYVYTKGSKIQGRPPEEYLNQLVDFSVEIIDVYGNVKVHSQKLQL